MCDEKANTVESLSKAIEEERLKCELYVLKTLGNNLEQGSGKPVENNQDADEEKGDERLKNLRPRTITVFSLVSAAIVTYAVLIFKISTYLISFSPECCCHTRHLCNNVCVLLSLVLILSTIAVIFLVRCLIASHQSFVETYLKSENKNQGKGKEDKALSEKMAEKVQAAVLEIVVKDTVDSFKKKC